MRWIVLCSLLLIAASCSALERAEQNFIIGTVTLQVDEKKVRVDALKRYMAVHPVAYDPKYLMARQIPLCIDGDAAYKPCGTRNLQASYFNENAETNINLSKADLAYLESLKEFPELQPLVNYFIRSLRFSLWKNERLLAYSRTWDVRELERNFESLPIAEETKNIISKLKMSSDRNSRWKIGQYEWHNAVNHLYRNQEGELPKHIWDHFLRTHQIKETIVYEDVDC